MDCEISDDGLGLSEKYRSRIFNPFFTTKKPGKGTGFDLYTAYDIIINEHQRTIEVHSKV